MAQKCASKPWMCHGGLSSRNLASCLTLGKRKLTVIHLTNSGVSGTIKKCYRGPNNQSTQKGTIAVEQNQILSYLGALFKENAPITDEVFSALKAALTPKYAGTDKKVTGENKRIRAALDSLGFRHGKNLNAYVEYQMREDEGKSPLVFLTVESEDGHFTSRHSKLTFRIYEAGGADTILECSSSNGEGWFAYEIPTMLGVGAAYYALLSWEAYKGIQDGRLEQVQSADGWDSYLDDYPEVEHDERSEEECLMSAFMILSHSAEEVSDDEDEEEDE